MTQKTGPKREAKKYDYVLTANAPHSILIETDEESSQFSAMGGTVTETFDGETLVEIPFSHENALKLRHFLKGRRVKIDARAKATLARLADDPEATSNKEIIWAQRLSELKDVPHKVGKRGMKGLSNKYDLLHYFPLRYIDKSNPQTVDELTPGVWAVVVGEIVGQPTWDPVRSQVRIVVSDAKNQRVSATFFRQPWYAHQYREGDAVVLYGNFSVWVNQRGHKVPQITNPKMDKVTTSRGSLDFIPVYPQKDSNKTWEIQLATKTLLENIVWLEDPVPQPLLDKYDLMSRDAAYREIHYPTGRASIEEARRRIAFDEFVRLQVFLRAKKDEAQGHHSPAKTKVSLAETFRASLPFTFTSGQDEAIQEILADMAKEKPMYRLLQGDVGSGKAQPLYSKVLTPSGFVKMGDVQVGDEVVTPSGGVERILGVFPQEGERPVYELTFRDGTKARADENHLWSVSDQEGKPFRNVTTKTLVDSFSSIEDDTSWHIQVPTGLASSKWGRIWDDEKVDPYYFGYDSAAGETLTSISDRILSSDGEARLAALQGILDAAGAPTRTQKQGVTLAWAPKDLAEVTASLIRGLGGSALIAKRPTRGGAYWNLTGYLPQGVAPFRDAAKLARYNAYSSHVKPTKLLASVEFVNYEETQCILISGEDHLYITDDFIPTHNTEVASYSTLAAVGSGYQAVMLAPTDVLASQLFDRLVNTFGKAGLDVPTELFTGRVTGKRREALLERLHSGETRVLVGTHSVINPEVKFENLGLVVVDEQHKFGVEQRTALLSKGPKGHRPDLLMMSATPIPRTTSQVVYGDMDISIVNTPPSGRKQTITEWHQYPDVAWEKVREQVKAGRQAYVVAALVEENDTIVNVQAATDVYEQLRTEIFPDLRVGLVHGKLKKKEKDETVKSFTAGEIDILVATTVIEVGVNVPNATVMTVLNSGRYGIASLHQIRGRVGRGSDQAWCYLVSDVTSAEGEERLNALVYTTDGFWLAEKDLELRGEGNLFGQLQSGDSDMAVANLRDHKDLLEVAKKVAAQAEKSVMLKREVETLYAGRVISA